MRKKKEEAFKIAHEDAMRVVCVLHDIFGPKISCEFNFSKDGELKNFYVKVN